MGTWGAGNFENDAALDIIGNLIDEATKEIEGFVKSNGAGIEDLEQVVACVAAHLALHEHCAGYAPDQDLANQLRTKALRIYDGSIDSLDPDREYKVERRAVLVHTLDAYAKAAQGE